MKHAPIILRVPKPQRCRMEPELEFICNEHYAGERVELAKKFERWARQIRMSLSMDFDYPPPGKAPPLWPPEPRSAWRLRNN